MEIGQPSVAGHPGQKQTKKKKKLVQDGKGTGRRKKKKAPSRADGRIAELCPERGRKAFKRVAQPARGRRKFKVSTGDGSTLRIAALQTSASGSGIKADVREYGRKTRKGDGPKVSPPLGQTQKREDDYAASTFTGHHVEVVTDVNAGLCGKKKKNSGAHRPQAIRPGARLCTAFGPVEEAATKRPKGRCT